LTPFIGLPNFNPKNSQIYLKWVLDEVFYLFQNCQMNFIVPMKILLLVRILKFRVLVTLCCLLLAGHIRRWDFSHVPVNFRKYRNYRKYQEISGNTCKFQEILGKTNKKQEIPVIFGHKKANIININ
jgi:hypothetical protein